MSIKHVLVVDDSKAARLVLRKMLQGINLAVDMAASGEEALTYLTSNRPDAIFMDHTMPGMDGLQVIRMIKNNSNTAQIPVAMYTSKEETGYIEQVKANGAVGILPKPASPDTLSQIINQLNEAADAFKAQSAALNVEEPDAIISANDAMFSVDAIETTVKAAAESVVNDAIRTQILPLFDEKLDIFKESLLTDQESTVLGIAGQVCDRRINGYTDKLNRQFNDQIKEIRDSIKTIQASTPSAHELIEQVQASMEEFVDNKARQMAEDIMQQRVTQAAREAATAVYQERAGELSSQLAQQLSKRLAATKTNLQETAVKSNQQSHEDMREMVKSVAATMVNQSAREAAEKTANDVANKIMVDVSNVTKSVINRMYYLAISTVVVGATTATAVIYYMQ